jgi:hypothetical protein
MPFICIQEEEEEVIEGEDLDLAGSLLLKQLQ